MPVRTVRARRGPGATNTEEDYDYDEYLFAFATKVFRERRTLTPTRNATPRAPTDDARADGIPIHRTRPRRVHDGDDGCGEA